MRKTRRMALGQEYEVISIGCSAAMFDLFCLDFLLLIHTSLRPSLRRVLFLCGCI